MAFEAEHEECLRVCPYYKNGEVVVHFYVYSRTLRIPAALITAAQVVFEPLNVRLEWSDLYNDAYDVLNVTPIEHPSGEPNRLEASQVDEIEEVIHQNLHVFSKHRNITAVQPSFKVTQSVETKEACITVYVLGKGDIPVDEFPIPRKVGVYPVDIMNGFCIRTTKPYEPIETHKQKDSVCLGANIGVSGIQSSGTLGAVVEDEYSKKLYVLSCDHVMSHGDSLEVIHPGLDVYLNYLHYHLNLYKQWISRNEINNLPPSFDIPQNYDQLVRKFNEIKTIKENHSDSIDVGSEHIREHETVLEKTFSRRPRIIANYSAGIRHNVKLENGKEHFVDVAISELKEDEQKKLKDKKTIEIIDTAHFPSGECIPAENTLATEDEVLFKSGSGTGLTNSSLLIGGFNRAVPINIQPPMFRQQGAKPWIDVNCLICRQKLDDTSSQFKESWSSPCEVCMPDSWLKSCLCIRQQAFQPFSDAGDSGAVVFVKQRKTKGEDYQTSCPGLGIIFGSFLSQNFIFTLISPLETALEALSQEVSTQRPDMPCKLKMVSRFN